MHDLTEADLDLLGGLHGGENLNVVFQVQFNPVPESKQAFSSHISVHALSMLGLLGLCYEGNGKQMRKAPHCAFHNALQTGS